MADVLSGKYTVRTRNVRHVCRYCHCPTDLADNPRVNYPPKTQAEIQKLVNGCKMEQLQAISQQYIDQNAWYDVRFHQANAMGIHGACPSEKLHAIQLGISSTFEPYSSNTWVSTPLWPVTSMG